MAKIIAELGINHNGDLHQAVSMATAAKAAGCEYVKLQKRDVERCYTEEELAKPCESPWGETVRDKVAGRELSWAEIQAFDSHCRNIGIEWTASCFDLASLSELGEFYPKRPFNKVASAMAKFSVFLSEVADQGILTLISTGLVTDAEVNQIVSQFDAHHCPFVLMHCCARYPAPVEQLNLSRIQTLEAHGRRSKWFQGVGYSGHEPGVLPSVVAVERGAEWVERHFTLDRTMYGADQAASLEPAGLERLVRDVRQLEALGGDPVISPVPGAKIPVTFLRTD